MLDDGEVVMERFSALSRSLTSDELEPFECEGAQAFLDGLPRPTNPYVLTDEDHSVSKMAAWWRGYDFARAAGGMFTDRG